MTERRRRRGQASRPPGSSRAVALGALAGVRSGRNLPEALAAAGLDTLAVRDRAFARRLALHAVRHRRRLETQIASYLERPARDVALNDLLWLGAAQVDLDDIAAHAAVNSTVELAPRKWRGLVNAVLRRRLREPPPAPASAAEALSFPNWLYAAISADWGGQAEAVLSALNTEPALCLRVNRQQCGREDYRRELAALQIESEPVGSVGLRLHRHVALSDLPGHAGGRVSVQGAAAQCAAELLDLQPGLAVLDACAAPGGKTAALLEREPGLAVTAVDIDATRAQRIDVNLQRLGLRARVVVADLCRDGEWTDDYDRILLDAPCSGTGVIARHPDIKWLRRAADLPRLAEEQGTLLRQLWARLRPGGQLLYCTCSILTAENDAVVAAFVADQRDAKVDRINLPFGQVSEYGWRIAPHDGLEGFYYARLNKQ